VLGSGDLESKASKNRRDFDFKVKGLPRTRSQKGERGGFIIGPTRGWNVETGNLVRVGSLARLLLNRESRAIFC